MSERTLFPHVPVLAVAALREHGFSEAAIAAAFRLSPDALHAHAPRVPRPVADPDGAGPTRTWIVIDGSTLPRLRAPALRRAVTTLAYAGLLLDAAAASRDPEALLAGHRPRALR